MEAELTSLDSQLERAKMTHAARCSRLEVGKMEKAEISLGGKISEVKRALFSDESDKDSRRHPSLDPNLRGDQMDNWTPQLDFSQDETKVNTPGVVCCCRCWLLSLTGIVEK